MIYLEMSGRLGNQLFRYSFAERLKEVCGDDIIIDFKRVYDKGSKEQGWDNSLKLFKINDYKEVINQKEIFYKNATIMQKILYILYKIGNKIYKKDKKKLIKYQLKMQPILNKYNF